MTEREVEKTRRRERKTVSLDHDREADLLAGAANEVTPTSAAEDETLQQFAQKLDGYRQNKERQQAWIRQINLPTDGTPEHNEQIEIEFLLPSGDTFTRIFRVPPQTWPPDNDLVQLLEHVGRNPTTLTQMLGDSVDIEHHEGEWQLAIDTQPRMPDSFNPDDAEQPTSEEERIVNTAAAILFALVIIIHLAFPLAVFTGVPAVLGIPLALGAFILFIAITYTAFKTL